MNTKLTLRMDEMLIQQAKYEAKLRDKSVSQMFSEFIEGLASQKRKSHTIFPPVTSSLIGVLRGHELSESDYKNHLREKYL